MAARDWYDPRRPTQQLADKRSLYRAAAERIGAATDLRYLEFGVYAGWSMRNMLDLFTNPNAEFVGFDSFLGLPAAWGAQPAGTFATDGVPPVIQDARVDFVQGWFQNSVPSFLPRLAEPKPVTLVNFDADLYSSTLFVLTTLWSQIPEYYFLFDEFEADELIALDDFCAAFPVEVEFYAFVAVPNRNEHDQVFGRMRRVPMVVDGS